MAEETDHISVSNETNKAGEEISPDHSMKKPRVAKKVPHYLRASTGSCHEACKYGHPHKIKDKLIRPVRRKMSASLSDGGNRVEIQIYVDKNVQKKVNSDELKLPHAKESALASSKLKQDSSSFRKSPVHDSSKLVRKEARSLAKFPSPDVPKVTKKVVVQSTVKTSLSDTSKMSKPKVAEKNVTPKRIPLNPKEKNASEGSLKPNGRGEKPSSFPNPLKISKQEVASAAKKNVPSKRTPLSLKERNASEGPFKQNGRSEKPSSSRGSFHRSNGKQTRESKMGDNPRTSRVAVVKTVGPLAAPLPLRTPKVEVKKLVHPTTAGKRLKDQSRRSPAFAKNQILADRPEAKEPLVEKAEEKTLHMIDAKEDYLSTAPDAGILVLSPTPLSPESLNSSSGTNSLSFTSQEVDDLCELDSEYTDDSEADDSVLNYNSSGDSKPADSLKEREAVTQSSEGQHPGTLKLKFRKGKVIEHPSETKSPRRLRFRRGKTLSDDKQATNGGAQLKSYKKTAADDETTQAESGLVQVVLKHQEIEMKKDEQVLLNNVIEETANKLVEKRKSKVKALVGAFESVISLQERKPSAADR